MEKVKILVVEDEVIVAQSIISMIEKMGYECIGTATRATEGLAIAIDKKPDIALLDINLKGEESGIWLAENINEKLQIPYIFLTSFGDKKTIDEAKSTMPYGYLLKPVEAQNIYAAIEMALARFSLESNSSKHKGIASNISEINEENGLIKVPLLIKDALFIKDEYQYVKITLSDIEYIKSDGNYVEIYINGKKKVLKNTLKHMESRLPADNFFQVHRSYIVNVQKIQSISGTSIKVNNTDVPIVKERKDMLLRLITL